MFFFLKASSLHNFRDVFRAILMIYEVVDFYMILNTSLKLFKLALLRENYLSYEEIETNSS